MVIANVKRAGSSALPARHERSSVLAVESVIRGETLGRISRREAPRCALLAMKCLRHAGDSSRRLLRLFSRNAEWCCRTCNRTSRAAVEPPTYPAFWDYSFSHFSIRRLAVRHFSSRIAICSPIQLFVKKRVNCGERKAFSAWWQTFTSIGTGFKHPCGRLDNPPSNIRNAGSR